MVKQNKLDFSYALQMSMTGVGTWLREARKERKVSQTELGLVMGYKKATISQIETGHVKTIKGDALVRAANYLKVSIAWLATGKGEKYAILPIADIEYSTTFVIQEIKKLVGENMDPMFIKNILNLKEDWMAWIAFMFTMSEEDTEEKIIETCVKKMEILLEQKRQAKNNVTALPAPDKKM